MRDLQTAGGTAIAEVSATPSDGIRVRRLRLLVVGIAVVGFVLDLVTKNLAIALLDPQQPIPLLGGLLTLRLIRNPGAAFSMGEDFTVVLSIVALVALVTVSGWMVPRVRHLGWAVATGFLLAGIAGNLADRLFREPGPFHGHVVDFLQLPYFAIFNVADIWITTAAVLLVWLSMITQVTMAGLRLADDPDGSARDDG